MTACNVCGAEHPADHYYPRPDGSRRKACRRCFNQRNERARILRVYGITSEQFDNLMAAQGDACRICRLPNAGRRLAIDHDHQTGAVRGILCDRCNHALGLMRDDPELFRRAAEYLEAANV